MNLGMIGLGRTGLPLAVNLMGRGHSIVGYRRSDASELAKAGGKVAKSPREVAESAKVIFSCLPNAAALDTVMTGEGGMLAALGPEHLVIEVSSYPLAVKEKYQALLAEKGATLVDGEISGTPAMTAARASVLLVAGPKEACERVLPVCRDATDHAIFCGPFGSATKLKLVANLLVAVHTVAAAEAMLLVERGGLDVPLAIEVLGLGAGSSTMFKQRAGTMAARKFTDPAPGPVTMLSAYLDAIGTLAKNSDSPTPLFDISEGLLKKALAEGRGAHDIGCVIDLLDTLKK